MNMNTKKRKLNKFIVCMLALMIAVSCFGGYILNDYIQSPKKNDAGFAVSDENIYKPNQSGKEINSIIADVLVKGVTLSSKLITTEVNLNCDIIIDESYLDWTILKKRQALKFYATALYAIDLENFTKDNIVLGEYPDNIKISIYIEEPKLISFGVNPEKTIVGKLDRGLLRFGDIRLTLEDFKKIQLNASVKMTEQLHNEEIETLTKQNAKKTALKFFQAVLENFQDYDFEIEIEFKP